MTRGRASPLSRFPDCSRESTATGETFVYKPNAHKARAISRIFSSPVSGARRRGRVSQPFSRCPRKWKRVPVVRDGDEATSHAEDLDPRGRGTRTSRRDDTSTLRRLVVGWRRCHPDGHPGGRKAHYFAGCTRIRLNRACTIGDDSQRSSESARDPARIRLSLSLSRFSSPSLLARLYPSLSLSLSLSGSMCAVLARAIQTPIGDLLVLASLTTTTMTTACAFRCVYMYMYVDTTGETRHYCSV